VDTTLLIASAVAAVGVAVVTIGLLGRARDRELALADILGLPYGEDDVELKRVVAEHGVVVAGTLGLAGKAVERWDDRGSLRERIERADLSLRPAELVVIAGSGGFVAGVAGAALTGLWWVVPITLLLTPLGTRMVLDVRATRRANRFAHQLPDALALVAGSLEAGHTFLRSIQLMSDEFDAPLSDEFGRVVAETQLGLPLVTSLERMATRIKLRDVDWMVQAIHIQQSVGGSLADLLATLAEFMRARDEVRREIKVLTAEGRLSAWILGAMPVVLFLAVQVVNPGYLEPMLQGWGLVWLGLTMLSMGVGMWLILRMVNAVDV
jgi:tight adherence protein B